MDLETPVEIIETRSEGEVRGTVRPDQSYKVVGSHSKQRYTG